MSGAEAMNNIVRLSMRQLMNGISTVKNAPTMYGGTV
jgi:hypothetical protein